MLGDFLEEMGKRRIWRGGLRFAAATAAIVLVGVF